MPIIVLCNFSVPVDKYLLKINQYHLPSERTILTPASRWRCPLNSREKWIKVMLQGSGCVITPGIETKSAINFFPRRSKFRIIPLLGNKVLSRNHSQMNKALTQIAAELGGVA